MPAIFSKKALRQKKTIHSALPYIICLLASAFYLYEFILQASMAVITHEVMRDFAIEASGVGLISAIYFFVYAPMQIPAGLMFDRYSARLLLAVTTAMVAIGAICFMSTTMVFTASLGRVLMGIGSAFSFIGTLVLVARWFPARYFALIAGVVQLMSSVGAILSGMPLAKVISFIGWRESFFGLGIIGLILAVLIWLFVRDSPESVLTPNAAQVSQKPKQSFAEIVKFECARLMSLLRNKQTLIIGAYAFLVWAPITVFPLLWGIPFLKTLYGINDADAAFMTMMIWVGIGVGSPLIGWFSNVVQRRCFPLAIAALMGLVSTTIILYAPHLPAFLMMFLLFIFGLAASGQSLSFALVNDINKRDSVGTAIGFNNMAVVVGGFFFQPVVGWILDFLWDGTLVNHVRQYQLMDYRAAMLLLPICYLLALYLSKRHIKETRCQALHESEDTGNVNQQMEAEPA